MSDTKTILFFRERLTQAGVIERLFDVALRNAVYLPMSGQILGATLAPAPKQCNTNAEKADLQAARWNHATSDLAIPFFSYKSHVAIDWKLRLIMANIVYNMCRFLVLDGISASA